MERDIRTQISLSFASETLGAGAAEKIVCWAEAGGVGGVGAASEAMPSAGDGRRGGGCRRRGRRGGERIVVMVVEVVRESVWE